MSIEPIYKHLNEKLGTLIHTTGPNDIHCFKGEIKDVPEGFVIILNHGDLEKVPESFIYSVVEKSRFYMNESLKFIKETLQRSPEILGLTLEEASQYLNSGQVPVDLPQFVFYEDQEWMLLYQICDFPIGYSYGMGVNFKEYKAVDIVDLSESEIIK